MLERSTRHWRRRAAAGVALRTGSTITRAVALALVGLLVLAPMAFADVATDTSTTLSTDVTLPSTVGVGANSFTIRVWGTNGSPGNNKTGIVSVVNSYTMASNGTITAGTSTTAVDFADINYSQCPSSGSVPRGCPGNPFLVPATLTVAAGTPGGRTGLLTIATSTGGNSGMNADTSPAQGRVRVGGSAPTVGAINGSTTVDEGSTSSYAVTATDPDGDALTYAWSVASGDAAVTGTANAATASIRFGEGPGTATILVAVSDGSSAAVVRTLAVSIANVAPSATFSAPTSVSEGSSFVLALGGPSDPSAVDTGAGFQYAFDCGDGYDAFSSTSTRTCATDDDGSRAVRGRIRDADGGVSEYTGSVAVTNVAPSAAFSASSPVDEGSAISLTLADATDVSSVDRQAGFSYAFDCGDGFGAFGSSSTASCPTSDDGTRTVRGRVRDADDGVGEYTITSVTVASVAPTATFSTPGSVDEGSAVNIGLTDPIDPSSADTAAGFTYTFDCGSGYGAAGTAAATSCTTTDDGVRTVKATISDDDGASTEYTAQVTVLNVAPTAVFRAPTSVDEGDTIELAFTNAADVSPADTAAGFAYSFDCGAGFGPPTSTATHSCPTTDDGTRSVAGRVIDEDGGAREYSATVDVANVTPTVDAGADATIDEGGTFSGVGSFADPGADDWTATVDYGDGSSLETLPLAADKTFSLGHSYVQHGTYTVTVVVDDGDSSGSDTLVLTVANVLPVVAFDGNDIDEGGTYTAAGSFTDPGTGDGWTATVDYGDGSTVEPLALGADKSFSLSHTYADDGTYSVTVAVTDDDATGTGTATVLVANVAPVVAAGEDAGIDEGGTFAGSGSFTDPGADAWTATVDYGDGGGDQGLTLHGATFSLAHTYAQDGSYTVTVTVTDDEGGTHSDTVAVTVANVAPTVNAGADAAILEGATFGGLGTYSDPGADVLTATVDYGDGSGIQPLALDDGGFVLSHQYLDNPTAPATGFTVTVRIDDGDGGSTPDTVVVTVSNVGPTVSAGPDVTIDEGDELLQNGSFTDPGADTWSATVDYGDGPGPAALDLDGTNFSLAHRYTDNGSYAATVLVTDDEGGAGSDSILVTVDNVAPSVSAGHDVTMTEGSTLTRPGSFTDPGADIWSATVDYGDSNAAETLVLDADKGFQLDHTYADDGAFTVTVTITDDDGGSDEATFVVTVTNVAPVVDGGADGALDEGGSFAQSGAFTDPGADTWTATVDYGDGTGVQTLAVSGKTFSLSHTYAQDGTYTVTIVVEDDDASGSDTLVVTVRNVLPVVTFAGGTAAEGSTFTTSGSFSDPGADAWSATVDYGDGTSGPLSLAADKTFTLAHAYADDGLYTITVTVTDDDATGSDFDDVTVTNVAPTVDAGSDATLDEGSTFISTGSFSDPGADTWTASVDYGDGTGVQPLALTGTTFGLNHTYADEGLFTVTVTVTDDDSGTGSDTAVTTVSNVAPVVNAGGDATVAEGGTFSGSGSFTDPGADAWAATVDYGDGSGVQPLTLAGKSFELSHPYADNSTPPAAGYTVTVTVTDGDGGEHSDTVLVTVSNVGPDVDTGDDATVAEGGTFTGSGSFTDPGADTWTGDVDYGDGGGLAGLPLDGQAFDLSHTYADDCTCTATVTVTDDDGGQGSDSLVVTVTNVAPAVDAGADDAIDEGDAFTSTGSFTDPGADTWTATVDYGDGAGPQPLTLDGKDFSLSHAYTQDGEYDVTVVVTDDDEGTHSDTARVVVTNVAPTVSAGADASVSEGAAFQRSGSFTDPGADTWTATVDYGDGSGEQPLALTGTTFELNHVYAQDGTFTVTVTVHDDDGSTQDSVVVTVTNVAPSVTVNGGSANEGSVFSGSGSFTDPGADSWSATVDYGDGSPVQALALLGATFVLSHTYADNGNYTVTVTVEDDDTSGPGSATASILNVAPTLVLGGGGDVAAVACAAGNAVQHAFTVTDPAGSHDPITGTVNWGDGTSTAFAGSSFSGSHVYAPGAYTITVTANDGDGGVAAGSRQVTHLYRTSGILPPLNADGSSVVQKGSTVPVKVAVTDCRGALVSTLTPTVTLTRVAPAPATAATQVVSSSAADTGQTMRWAGSQYLYNLSTRRSAFAAGQDLTDGRYTLQITSPAFSTIVVPFTIRG